VEELVQGFLNWITSGFNWVYASLGGGVVVIAAFAAFAAGFNSIADFVGRVIRWIKAPFAKRAMDETPPVVVKVETPIPQGSAESNEYKTKLVESVSNGTISTEDATQLAYALAGERFDNPPPASDELPTGQEPAEEFIREFVALATSKNEREREAAALDAEGRTEEALALLQTLAEEEAAQAAERWKARGAMAFNAFTAKAIDSYERAVGCNPDDAEAHNQLGHLYDRTGDLDRARAAYEKVLALGNQSADQSLLAIAYGISGPSNRRGAIWMRRRRITIRRWN